MKFSKRLFDILVALWLLIPLVPVIAGIALLIRIKDGKSVFYVAERMKTVDQGFALIKFRTMKAVSGDSGVSGGDKSGRITSTGAFLRKTRLDELPQLFNVLRGDISFVGPRPPLRQYTERFPEIYAQVLQSRPGITGLATLYYHIHEEQALAGCQSYVETDDVYTRVCIPRKARLDLVYQRNQTLCLDISLMVKTVFRSRITPRV